MGDLLIVDNGGNGNSTLALDKKTGKKVWGKGNEPAGYATPTPIIQGGKPAVVLFKGKSLVAYDVKKGKPLWDVDWETSYDVNASSPIPLPNNQLLVTSGYGGGRAVLFDISGSKPKQLWRNDDIKTKMSSAVVHDGHVFAVCGDNDGKLVCVSLSKGKTVWEEDKFGFGTLALAGDKLLVLSDKGTLVVTPASAKGYAPISEAQVLGKVCWVKPVLAYGLVYAKNNKGSLVCLDLR
jgi:outer membrane protein assembly factor BamB